MGDSKQGEGQAQEEKRLKQPRRFVCRRRSRISSSCLNLKMVASGLMTNFGVFGRRRLSSRPSMVWLRCPISLFVGLTSPRYLMIR
ncbi:hypothetical protein N665_0158s0063 [Sinapis alba]|nr:hypothetical protein N665_0158s0063 [Sinapis alba]